MADCSVLGGCVAVCGAQNTGDAHTPGCLAGTWSFRHLGPFEDYGRVIRRADEEDGLSPAAD